MAPERQRLLCNPFPKHPGLIKLQISNKSGIRILRWDLAQAKCLCLYEPGAPNLDVAKRNSGSTGCRIWSDSTEPVLVSAFRVSPLTLIYFSDPPVVLDSSGGVLDKQHCPMPSRVLIKLFSAFIHEL